MDKIFSGFCFGDPKQRMVAVRLEDRELREVLAKRSRVVKNYSPFFNWGYMSCGAHQLGLAILLEVTNDAKLALKYHQAFTAEVITSITDGDSDWDMDEVAILKWISRQS